MVSKGSVAIEGISLTIAAVDDDTISIAILPLTYWRTNLHALAPGAPLNVEADVLVKLAWQQMQDRSISDSKPTFDLTEPWLIANGY
jgi:riboflavin synthase